ncbi:hypothetical protein [Xanthobacter versatilis]|uniref:hypothetical protein n=1 Tax=Xanthobacter autotrophicus (strain ATCC BAA-1158 / Py2) TaxID=78245 RepID=UPI00372C35DA
MLKLTFAGRLQYARNEGFRTADLSLPFKVLANILCGEKEMAHPARFERATSAFGGNMASSAKKRKEPPMPAYLSVNAKQFEFLLRRSYSSPRHSFRPRAYVVLTREETVGSEEAHA